MSKSFSANSRWLLLVAITKLADAALMFVAAIGLHHLLHGDAQEILLRWIRAVRVDSDNHLAHAVLTRVTGLSNRRLEALSLGTFMYGTIFTIEGVGLLSHKRWAEWLTVVTTAGFLPVEIYETVQRVRLARIVILAINLAIVVYLIKRLVRHKPTDEAADAK